jgi:hypothetical protein
MSGYAPSSEVEKRWDVVLGVENNGEYGTIGELEAELRLLETRIGWVVLGMEDMIL